MRVLTILVALVAALWSAWWFAGRTAFERGAEAGVAALRARGWDVAYDGLRVAGYPNRFDATVDAPRLVAPGGAVAWEAPFVQVLALAYRPQEVIVVAADTMALDLPQGRVDVTAGDLRASAAVTPSLEPEVVRATVVGEAIGVAGAGLDGLLDRGQVALRRANGAAAYDVALDLDGLRPGASLRAAIDPFEALPAVVDGIDADLAVTLDAPLGVRGGTPRPTALDLRAATFAWGDLRVTAAGRVDVDAAGVPEGRLTLEAAGWQAALRLAASLGLVGADRLPLLTAGLAGMAEEDGRITLELVFDAGAMRLGPIPLGPAPRLR